MIKIYELVKKPTGVYGQNGTNLVPADLLLISGEAVDLWTDAGTFIYRLGSVVVNSEVKDPDDLTAEFEVDGRANITSRGSRSTFIGQGAGANEENNAFRFNVGLGTASLFNVTTGYNNVGIGLGSLASTTTGYDNIGIGIEAGEKNITGYQNIALGNSALYENTTGFWNIAIGQSALFSNNARDNVAIGFQAGLSNTTGNANTIIGTRAYETGEQGQGNVIIGAYANQNQGANASVIIGNLARTLGNGGTNEIVIGRGAVGNGTNTTTIGDTSTVTTYLKGNLNIASLLGTPTGTVTPIGRDQNGFICVATGGGGGGGITDITAGANITIDKSDPAVPIISAVVGADAENAGIRRVTASHNFTEFSPIAYDANLGGWVKASAVSGGILAQGVAINVTPTQFDMVNVGAISRPAHGFPVGSVYFLSDTAGEFSPVAGDVDQPLFVVTDPDHVQLLDPSVEGKF